MKYNREYYKANAERLKEYQRQWRRDHPRQRDRYKRESIERRKSLEDTLTEMEWEQILRDSHHLCVYCGRSDCELEEDHWVPASLGGSRTAENIVPSCHSCNSKKGTLPGDLFLDVLDIEEWETIRELAEAHCS